MAITLSARPQSLGKPGACRLTLSRLMYIGQVTKVYTRLSRLLRRPFFRPIPDSFSCSAIVIILLPAFLSCVPTHHLTSWRPALWHNPLERFSLRLYRDGQNQTSTVQALKLKRRQTEENKNCRDCLWARELKSHLALPNCTSRIVQFVYMFQLRVIGR